jgi:predicted enzyme related to lactoylglutathione lyase
MTTTENDRRIVYVELAVTDIAKTKEFYRAVFGYQFQDYGPDYTCFFDGRIGGGFYKGEPKRGTVLVVFQATDLEAMERTVRNAGGAIVKPIFAFPGGRRFHFTDPSGNELAICTEEEA